MMSSAVCRNLSQTWSSASHGRDFVGQCIDNYLHYSDCSQGLVNSSGLFIKSFDDTAVGIGYSTCLTYCNSSGIPADFSFQVFAQDTTNYFLPWIALCAQLPYETGDAFQNVMSFFLAIGSPALSVFSLAITILNRRWVRQRFHRLWRRSRDGQAKEQVQGYGDRILAAQYLLQEAQQIPIRLSQEEGWLSSLLVVPANQQWWTRVRDRLRDTRRGITPSLVAQILVAVLSYLMAVIASFLATLGIPSTDLPISAGSLWIWTIPLILGWVTVGTQTRATSITDALENELARRAIEDISVSDRCTEKATQKGIQVMSGLPRPNGPVGTDGPGQILVGPRWMGLDVSGDERILGPVFNYARIFTWFRVASTIERAIDTVLNNIAEKRACQQDGPASESRQWSTEGKTEDNLIGDRSATAQYCELEKENAKILAYPSWKDITGQVWKRLIAAFAIALFVQWGTTGPSVMMAFLTPVQGLGCRSGGYLLYGFLGTSVLVLLLTSMLLSHGAMLMYQNAPPVLTSDIEMRSNDGNHDSVLSKASPLRQRTLTHSAICGGAVILRYLGKTIAVLNGMWLIVSSLMEYVGAYDNCWCMSNSLSTYGKGWVLLSLDQSKLAQEATTPWASGFATSIIVCMAAYGFFCLGSMDMASG